MRHHQKDGMIASCSLWLSASTVLWASAAFSTTQKSYCLSGEPSDTPVALENEMLATLKAELKREESDLVLTVRLRNISEHTIVIDRDLVFLLDIAAVTEDWENIPLELARPGRPAKIAQQKLQQRFVELPAGKEICRRIKLTQPFRVFEHGVGGIQEEQHIVTGYEAYRQFARDAAVKRIIVRYQPLHGFHEAFQQYMGVKASAIGLFEGPLRIDIAYE